MISPVLARTHDLRYSPHGFDRFAVHVPVPGRSVPLLRGAVTVSPDPEGEGVLYEIDRYQWSTDGSTVRVAVGSAPSREEAERIARLLLG